MAEFLDQSREATDIVLGRWAERAEREFAVPVGAAIAYALRAPGKRFRPALTLAVYRELSGAGVAVEFASAVEVVHTYSLVHDDLPCMDDDDLRRGRPTVHRQFDVPTATEAGFRMVPLAARVLAAGARRLGLSSQVAGAAGRELFGAAGCTGMIAGQLGDLAAEGRDVPADELYAIHAAKTGAIISASAVMGALAAGADDARIVAVRDYGKAIGLAFQIVDDVLDATGTSHELGKTAGKDARQGKATFAALLGPDGALARAHEHAGRAIYLLQAAGIDSPLLTDIARFVVNRRF